MKKSMSVLGAAFLGLGMTMTAPAFADEAVQTLTEQEQAELKKSSDLFICVAHETISMVDEILADTNKGMSPEDVVIKLQEVMGDVNVQHDILTGCEQQAGYTADQRQAFFDALAKKYGSPEKAWTVIENTPLKEESVPAPRP